MPTSRGPIAPAAPSSGGQSFHITTLGCPKNEVDSTKLAGWLDRRGYSRAELPEEADVVVVNTCAFIEPAREESIETILALAAARKPGARLAVTGCLAERHGAELAEAMPEIDVVAGFGADPMPELSSPVSFRRRSEVPAFDLLELERPPASAPFAYVKVAEGCDRRCGFCAIPSFRGRQRSRSLAAVLREVEALAVSEVVLVAQDLASYGLDRSRSPRDRPSEGINELVDEVARRVEWVRLLYLYPSSLTDRLVDTVLATNVPYFDLSLQHVSPAHLRRMRRWGSADRFLERVRRIRRLEPGAVLRSSFILGYPGETEADQDELLRFLEEAELDWVGLFTFSREAGTHADTLPESAHVAPQLAAERLAECAELQERITASRRAELIGSDLVVLADSPSTGRSYREAPEIDGIVELQPGSRRGPGDAPVAPGSFVKARCVAAEGPDLLAEVL